MKLILLLLFGTPAFDRESDQPMIEETTEPSVTAMQTDSRYVFDHWCVA